MTYHIMFNPIAGNGKGREKYGEILKLLPADAATELRDVTEIKDMTEYVRTFAPEDRIVLSGGDGTLNHFINSLDEKDMPEEVYFYPAGSGNDFLRDINGRSDALNEIGKYLRGLPTVEVNGRKYRFLNDVGYGIDGYCCEEADRQRANAKDAVNYTKIAIKGLLYAFKPRTARVTIDGETAEYKKAWMAPSMNGRYFGGGMMATPGQDRLNKAHTVSVMVFSGCGSLKTLIMFPNIFTGKHVKFTKYVRITEAHDVTVEFDKPCALQIDGETILNVSRYTVTTYKG